MEFGNHIKNLLYLYDCIIIPELGGFVAKYYPAKIDGLRRKVKPPCKEFSFDESLRKDGDVLVSFIARAKGIDVVEARSLVERFAAETRKIVMQGDRAEVPGLGWFFKGPNNRILFEFDIVNNFHPETAGLPEMNLPEFHKSDKVVMSEVENPQPLKLHKTRSYKFLFWFVPLLFLLGGGAMVIINWDSVKSNRIVTEFLHKFKSSVPKSNDIPPKIVMGLPDSSSAVEQEIDTSSSMKNALAPAAHGITTVQKDKYANCSHFYIIAGSFKRIKNAQELSSRLSIQGFKTEILTSKDGMYRVSLKVFTRRNEALQYLDKLKIEGKIKNIWLLSI